MNTIVLELVPVSSFVIQPKEVLRSTYSILKAVYDKTVLVVNEIIFPILQTQNKKAGLALEKSIPLFTKSCLEITEILHNLDPSIQKWTKKDVEIFEDSKNKITKTKWIDGEDRVNAIRSIDNLIN